MNMAVNPISEPQVWYAECGGRYFWLFLFAAYWSYPYQTYIDGASCDNKESFDVKSEPNVLQMLEEVHMFEADHTCR